MTYSISAGRASPLGATIDGDGVNFAVFSQNAASMFLCLFDAETGKETRLSMPERDGDVWHGHVAGIGAGQLYGFRAIGPYNPADGHRFNVNKLLLDPYARRITGHPVWNDALYGYKVGADESDLTFDDRDSAPYMPRCVVEDFAPDPAIKPAWPMQDSVIYEGHIKGLTARHPDIPEGGTFHSAASDPILEHLVGLGVTAVEFLPIHAFINDRFLIERGLTNYWGYQSIGFFAPDPRYLSDGRICDVRQMVDAFHKAGIEVILDVVYNHTGEGDHLGPTLSFRGLDNLSYYRLEPDRSRYVNDTGTGNTINMDHPMVLKMVMDSLRYWVQVMGIDGFRFDLAAVLGRTASGFDPGASFFDAIRQDPVLSGVKLIAEPWDIGPGGYQLGAFPPPFSEWNDKFRDDVRRFWRGDAGFTPDLAARLTGSAGHFDHSGRPATTSVNFVTAHDGMTLEDVVSYSRKHNDANGEGGKDGHNHDFSDNMGVEGKTDDSGIRAARDRRKRAMLATLLFSQGTPMILAGDEIGHTQSGNNNAYNQDNDTSWISWPDADTALLNFARRLIAFRKDHPILRQKLFLHSRERLVDGVEDLFWWREDGKHMEAMDWHDPARRLIAAEKRTAAGTPAFAALEYAVLLIFNAGEASRFALPPAPEGQLWCYEIDSADPDRARGVIRTTDIQIAEQSVSALVLVPETGTD